MKSRQRKSLKKGQVISMLNQLADEMMFEGDTQHSWASPMCRSAAQTLENGLTVTQLVCIKDAAQELLSFLPEERVKEERQAMRDGLAHVEVPPPRGMVS